MLLFINFMVHLDLEEESLMDHLFANLLLANFN